MTRKNISTVHASVSCDVCGRTLLRGEQVETYLAGGGRRQVCELCTPRALHEGWIREGVDRLEPGRRPEVDGRRSLLGRLRQRRERAASEGLRPLEEAEAEALGEDWPEDDEMPAPAPAPAPARPRVGPSAAPSPPPAGPVEPRQVHAVPSSATQKMARALELFNASEHPRTVSGVARSLGAPIVSVLPSGEHGSLVHVVVAWEISWYRYEVDLASEAGGVRAEAQGYELSELGEDERVPTAVADDQGLLSLTS